MTGDIQFPELPQHIMSEESAWEALASIHASVNHANRAILAQADSGSGHPESFYWRRMDDLPDKLKKWLERLYENLRQIVAIIADATSFSITVGTTISVTVNFAKP